MTPTKPRVTAELIPEISKHVLLLSGVKKINGRRRGLFEKVERDEERGVMDLFTDHLQELPRSRMIFHDLDMM